MNLFFKQKVGARILDLLFVRERASRRETKLLNVLLMVKSTLWRALFGKEADKLERANDDDKTYYIIEREPLVNRFISVPKDKVCYRKKTGGKLLHEILMLFSLCLGQSKLCFFHRRSGRGCTRWLQLSCQGDCTLAQWHNFHGEV